jgi:hypothetical protein
MKRLFTPIVPKARVLAQHGGPPGWLEEGVDFVHDGRPMPPALTDDTTRPGLARLIYY